MAPAQSVAGWLPSPWERSPQRGGGRNLGESGVLEFLSQPEVVPPCEVWHFRCRDSACGLQVFNFVVISSVGV